MQVFPSNKRSLRTIFVSPRFWLILILLAAWALRLFHLGAMSLWWDESLSWDRATNSLANILSNTIQIQNVATRDLHPPLYFLLLHGLVLAAGATEFALRFLSAFAGMLTLAMFVPLTRVLFGARGWRLALLTVLFAALSPFYVWYSQEARPYALVLFLSMFTLYALLRWLKTRPAYWRDFRSRWFVLFAIGFFVSFVTLYLSFVLLPFYAAAVLIFAERGRSGRERLRSAPTLFAAALVILFAVVLFLMPREVDLTSWEQAGPSFVPFFVMLRDVWNSFSVGLSLSLTDATWIDLFLLALWLVGIFSLVRVRSRDARLALLLACYMFVPAIALQLGSHIRPLYLNSRHLITTSPAFYIGLAVGVDALARRVASIANRRGSHTARSSLVYAVVMVLVLIPLLAVNARSLNNLYFDETYAKDDHKAWAEFLRERMRPGDYMLLVAPQAEKIVKYYVPPGLPWESLPTLGTTRDWQEFLDREAVLKAYRNHPRVWLLQLHEPVADPNLHITDLLTRWGKATDSIIFRGISTEIRLQSFEYDGLPQDPPKLLSKDDQIAFTRNLELVDYTLPQAIEAGGRDVSNLYWRVRRQAPSDVNVSLRVVDDSGKVWGQWDAPPVGQLKPLTTWETDKIVRDQHDLVVDPGTPPGKYNVELSVYTTPDGRGLPAFQGSTKSDAPVKLGEIQVTRPDPPPDPRTLIMDEHTDVPFGNTVRFLGYDLEERTTNPGSDVSLTLYFQMLQAAQQNLNGHIELGAPVWQFWNPTRSTAPFTLDTTDRQTGDIVQTHVDVRVPGSASPGTYDLRLALDTLHPQSLIPGDTAALGSVQVDSLARSTDLPPIPHPLSAHFDNKIELLGYGLDAPQPLKPDAPVKLTLYWRALAPMDTSYTVFAHLINGDNKIFGQKDKLPLDGARPTTGWAPGEVFTDTYEFNVASDAPPGSYRLEVGLYNGADFTRLPASDANGAALGDRVLFEDLQLQ